MMNRAKIKNVATADPVSDLLTETTDHPSTGPVAISEVLPG
ncbi:MAG: hypothetical protein ABI395_10790 [Sphingobium sp.]